MKLKLLKPVAIIDIDGCVCSLNDTANKQREAEGLKPLPLPQTWDWSGVAQEDRDYILNKCYPDPEFYRKPVPLPYAKNGLWLLSQKYEIVFVTARAFYQRDADHMSQAIADITETWLRKWEMPEHKLVHTHMSNKGQVVREMYGDRVAFAVEDSPSAIQSYIDAGIFTYVVGYPYNAAYQNDVLIKRVDTFADIAAHRISVERAVHELTIDDTPQLKDA